MDLMHIKLRTGEDLLGHVEKLNNGYRITSPISFEIDPHEGFFARSWLLFSAENSVLLSKDDIYFCNEASEKAINYYEEFVHQYSENSISQDEFNSDLEDMLLTFLESKHSTKH